MRNIQQKEQHSTAETANLHRNAHGRAIIPSMSLELIRSLQKSSPIFSSSPVLVLLIIVGALSLHEQTLVEAAIMVRISFSLSMSDLDLLAMIL